VAFKRVTTKKRKKVASILVAKLAVLVIKLPPLRQKSVYAPVSDKYAGANPCITLYIVRHSLKQMH